MDELKLQLEKELIAQREQSVLDYNAKIESVVDIENYSNMFDLIVSTYREEVIFNCCISFICININWLLK